MKCFLQNIGWIILFLLYLEAKILVYGVELVYFKKWFKKIISTFISGNNGWKKLIKFYFGINEINY